jgi:hypothetical protein
MRRVILLAVLMLGGFLQQTASAQVRIEIGENIGQQPVWGPTGYDYVEYYYLPDLDMYYYVPTRQYVYQQRSKWILRAKLPSKYGNYNLYNGYKVVINEPTPYLNADNYRRKYATYKGNQTQPNIRNSREEKYFKVKGHPEHSKWSKKKKSHKHD